MGVLFDNKRPLTEKLVNAVRMAIRHGKILAIFAFTYKSIQCLLTRLRGKSDPKHSFIAGLIGSYLLIKFKTDNAINR